jgi:hypothetical protein
MKVLLYILVILLSFPSSIFAVSDFAETNRIFSPDRILTWSYNSQRNALNFISGEAGQVDATFSENIASGEVMIHRVEFATGTVALIYTMKAGGSDRTRIRVWYDDGSGKKLIDWHFTTGSNPNYQEIFPVGLLIPALNRAVIIEIEVLNRSEYAQDLYSKIYYSIHR